MPLKRNWGQYFPRNKQVGDITQLPMVVKPWQLMKKLSFHQTGVPSTKMGGDRTFQGILAIPTLLVRTDNNPLTYIMTTPNLDATGHQWVGTFVRFNFQLEYQKGQDNTVADMLS